MQALVKVWDLPTRVFHWLLVLTLCASALSALYLENILLHAACGYAVLNLILFRLVWGFTGGYWSRFARFIPSFQQSLVYIRDPAEWRQPGHNPLGAWSVWGLLLLLLLQVISGMTADDDAGFTGPLSAYVSHQVVNLATFYHADIGKWLLLFFTVLHITAVFIYVFIRKQALLRAMFTGLRPWPFASVSSADSKYQRIKALLIFFLIAISVYAGLQAL